MERELVILRERITRSKIEIECMEMQIKETDQLWEMIGEILSKDDAALEAEGVEIVRDAVLLPTRQTRNLASRQEGGDE